MSTIIIAGGDEAGRGSVIGPLVISMVSIGKGKEKKLSDIGVRDSKLLSKKKRAFLFDEIRSISEEVQTYKITNDEINTAMKSGISINQLEAMHFARLLDEMQGGIDKAYIDSPDVIAERFGMRISLFAKRPTKVVGIKGGSKEKDNIKIISEHKADIKYPVVSAASIIAKVIRDSEMERIEEEVGIHIGSGYPGDKETVEVIKANLKSRVLSPYIREYWKTLENIRQRKMGEFPNFA
ncbi:Ribonuclease HII [uncultured archaeon]|nr:Ribonuclease HII [uncultured archaeon]